MTKIFLYTLGAVIAAALSISIVSGTAQQYIAFAGAINEVATFTVTFWMTLILSVAAIAEYREFKVNKIK